MREAVEEAYGRHGSYELPGGTSLLLADHSSAVAHESPIGGESGGGEGGGEGGGGEGGGGEGGGGEGEGDAVT